MPGLRQWNKPEHRTEWKHHHRAWLSRRELEEEEKRMSRKKIPDKETLVKALREADGNMAATSRKLHCHRATVWQYVNNDPELRELVDELSENFIDVAESQLFKLIREGNPAAIIFFLKTRARHRGYSEHL